MLLAASCAVQRASGRGRFAVVAWKRVKFIELCNGRIIFFKPAQSVAAARAISAMIEEVDPGFRVLGPVVCGIQLPCAATSILK